MFLVYINDLPSSVTSNVDLFADDSVIHRQISTSNDCVLFQGEHLATKIEKALRLPLSP